MPHRLDARRKEMYLVVTTVYQFDIAHLAYNIYTLHSIQYFVISHILHDCHLFPILSQYFIYLNA